MAFLSVYSESGKHFDFDIHHLKVVINGSNHHASLQGQNATCNYAKQEVKGGDWIYFRCVAWTKSKWWHQSPASTVLRADAPTTVQKTYSIQKCTSSSIRP